MLKELNFPTADTDLLMVISQEICSALEFTLNSILLPHSPHSVWTLLPMHMWNIWILLPLDKLQEKG